LIDEQWRKFFFTCSQVLKASGSDHPQQPKNWCTWTTFSMLNDDLIYWRRELPAIEDIGDTYIKDGGVWGQPFSYDDLAHIVIPRIFRWDTSPFRHRHWKQFSLTQNIDELSNALNKQNIPHQITNLVLEIKLY
jgi:hypothetical protein